MLTNSLEILQYQDKRLDLLSAFDHLLRDGGMRSQSVSEPLRSAGSNLKVMSLKRVLAAGFKHYGKESLSETELVAALALERGWFAPEEVRQVVEHALETGDLEGDRDGLSATFTVGEITIPSGYEPPSDILKPATPFERILDRVGEIDIDKRGAVAEINRLQSKVGLTNDAAAVLFGHGVGLDVSDEAQTVVRSIENTYR